PFPEPWRCRADDARDVDQQCGGGGRVGGGALTMLRGLRDRGLSFGQLPFVLVMVIVAVAGLRIGMYHWRQGAGLIAGALFAAAVLRGVFSTERAGLLAVRSRVVDVVSYVGLGLLILGLAIVLGLDSVN